MDGFDFEELLSDMLGITDAQREDDDFVRDQLYDKFELDFEQAMIFAYALLQHTPIVEAGLTGTKYHAFVSKDQLVMHMKLKAKGQS
jgi:hypothetical protein